MPDTANTSRDAFNPVTAAPASKMWLPLIQATALWTPTKLLRLNMGMLINFHIKIIRKLHTL
jgi:hypothetical protein